MEDVGDLDEGEGLVAQQARYVERGVAVYPVVGGISAHLLRYLGEVFGSDAEGVGIICHLAVDAVVAVLEHAQKAAHERCVLRRYRGLAVEDQMEVEEVEDGRLDGVDEELSPEGVGGLAEAVFDPTEVALADEALVRVEIHHGVEEERQLSLDAVVGLGCAQLDERGCDVEHLHLEVGRWLDALHELALADYHQVALREAEVAPVEGERAVSGGADGVGEVVAAGLGAKSCEGILDDDFACVFHNFVARHW